MRQNEYDLGDFTIEVHRFLKKCKKRKACGPDEIPIEYFMFWMEKPCSRKYCYVTFGGTPVRFRRTN